MYKYRNFPNLSGLLTWYNTLERKLETYTKRIKDVLGTDWKKQSAGRQLSELIVPISERIRSIRETQYKGWIDDMSKYKPFTQGRLAIFKISKDSNGANKLDVNFSNKALSLYLEKPTLKAASGSSTTAFSIKGGEVEVCYPSYVSL